MDDTPRDWQTLHRHAVDFHLRNARTWANTATGVDLTTQVDPDYLPGPHTTP